MPRKSTSITRVDGKPVMVSESYVSSPSSQFTACPFLSMHVQKCSPLGGEECLWSSAVCRPPSRLVGGGNGGFATPPIPGIMVCRRWQWGA